MAATFRLATFNVENLFARYRFRANADATGADGFTINDLAFDIYDEPEKAITGEAIRRLDADILCLQEVESLPVLERFTSRYLARLKYTHRLLVDGHDPRFIDVAVLSRFPVQAIRTWRHLRNRSNSTWLFARDCLELTLDVKGKPLHLYVNHLKSMMGGREETHERRKEQAEGVATIVDNHWKPQHYGGSFAILGDMNDYPQGNTALNGLLKHPQLTNIVERLPDAEQWTHYYAGEGEYHQLDYIFLPKPFDQRAGKPTPTILRDGLPWRAERHAGNRIEGVGENHPKASDHAPLAVDIPFAALN